MPGLTFGRPQLGLTRFEVSTFHSIGETGCSEQLELVGRVFCFEAPEQKTLLERVTHDITSVSGELASEFSISRYCLMLCAELFWLLSFSQIKATRFCLVFQFPVVLTRHTHMCFFLSIGGFYLYSQFL